MAFETPDAQKPYNGSANKMASGTSKKLFVQAHPRKAHERNEENRD
jgi:hypothetical protein